MLQCVAVDTKTLSNLQAISPILITITKNKIKLFYFQDGQTALHQAASAGHSETVAALVLGGCDIAIQDFVSCSLNKHFFQIQMKQIVELTKNDSSNHLSN